MLGVSRIEKNGDRILAVTKQLATFATPVSPTGDAQDRLVAKPSYQLRQGPASRSPVSPYPIPCREPVLPLGLPPSRDFLILIILPDDVPIDGFEAPIAGGPVTPFVTLRTMTVAVIEELAAVNILPIWS